jgi:proline dehydrogenase
MNVTLDHLGESTSTPDEAVRATDDILELLDEIDRSNLKANVSVKLTQIGLALDQTLCALNLEKILLRAAKYGNFIRVDMEDTSYTEKTLALFQQLHSKGYGPIGLVIQSYLYRSVEDVQKLVIEKIPIRLVKGAYNEPPDLAFPRKVDVDSNFDLLAQLMMDAALVNTITNANTDGRIPPSTALGTHDQKRIQYAKGYAKRIGLPKHLLEFQMLYGIRRDLQNQCMNEGYPVRIYVPYGTHWYPYFMRRLAERPANVWFFVSNFFRK